MPQNMQSTSVENWFYCRFSIHEMLKIVLSYGNYMNGGTPRGQADGFDLSILTKLKDVKSMDKKETLLEYLVLVYCNEHEDNAGKNEAENKMGDSSIMTSAAQVSFENIAKDLNSLKYSLNNASKKVRLINTVSNALFGTLYMAMHLTLVCSGMNIARTHFDTLVFVGRV